MNLKHFAWSQSYENQDLPHPERLGGYTPLTEAMIRKTTQSWFEQSIRKRWKGWNQIEVEEVHRPTPPIDYARWDEMRYLPTDNENFPIDSEQFAEKAAFAVAFARALEGQKSEPLERYRLDWKPGARTYVSERRQWRDRWPWAPHGPSIVRLFITGSDGVSRVAARLGPDLNTYRFKDEPPHLIDPPEPTQMIVPPEGDTYAFDWHLEQATRELAGLRHLRRSMKKGARLTDRYITWLYKDGQWRGHTLANPRDFVDLDRVIVFEGEDGYVRFAADPFLRAHVILEQDGVKIRFTGHPDEGRIPENQYEPLARFPKGKPRKTPEELQKTFDLRPTILVRRQNFIDLRKEWRKKKWWEEEKKGYDTPLELGPPAGDIREVVARTHPEWWVNWEWRIAGIKGAINEPARKHPKVPLAIKKKLNRRHYLDGLYTLTEKHLRAYYRHSGARNPAPVVDFRRIEIPIMRLGTSEELIPADATILPYEPQRKEPSKSWHEAMEKLSADQQREALSEGRRVHQFQKARRAQRAALTELCGYISSTTSRHRGGSEGLSNTGRALARWRGESFVDRLAAEVPGAVYLAYFDGRPQDVDRDDYRAAAIKKYNRAVKTGRGWSGLDSHIERLAQNARSWIVHDNSCDKDILGGDALEWANDPEWSEEKEIEGAAEDVAKMASSALNLDTGSDPDDDPGESEYDSYQLEPEDFDTYHFRESAQNSIEQRKAIEGFRQWGRRGSNAEKYKAIPAKGTLSDMWRQRLYPTYRAAAFLDLAGVRRMPPLDDKPPVTYIRTGEAPVREVVERGGVPVDLEPFTILAYPTYDDLRCEFRGRNGTCFGLTENQREAFLFYLDGRKHKDIAAEIKRSEDTVEDRISGGWRKIEKVLGTPVSRAVLRKKQDRREFTWEDMEGKRRKFQTRHTPNVTRTQMIGREEPSACRTLTSFDIGTSGFFSA